MIVIFIYGPAASGKYSIGLDLSQKMKLPLFHNHLAIDLVSNIFDFNTKKFNTLRNKIWSDVFFECGVAKKSFIFTFHLGVSVSMGLVKKNGKNNISF